MANPVLISCAKETMIKVATNVTSGIIYPLETGAKYAQTYRLTGQAAPTFAANSAELFPVPAEGIKIEPSAAIDVYVYCQVAAGSVRVDL